MTHPLALVNFEPRVSEEFRVMVDGQTVTLILAEIKKPDRIPKNYECYTLLFQGPLQPHLPQAIYQLENKNLEKTELFLVPVAGDDTGFDYEAIINRKPA